MPVVTYSYARQNLAELLDEVERDRAPVFISRQRKRGGAYLVSQEEWDSLQETMYLLSNPANAKNLLDAIAELNAGKGIEHQVAKPVRRRRRTKQARGR
ncbi:MAG: type II toxin-antitoxin system prevent-host-death family antitoxin [Alphaproteobacteria bacterium]|nr:type II toxin-antitoxin system prevent-host-death family antitoxin [Alphaproteobacteria bacterium]